MKKQEEISVKGHPAMGPGGIGPARPERSPSGRDAPTAFPALVFGNFLPPSRPSQPAFFRVLTGGPKSAATRRP
ncbi:hypothetical protein [Caproicibacter sp. BJN0012]|uniref:hypothetical protein n=1 Tax=Caproicibacter sp. BJN0012 TaxID=3110227 RepID=UPI002E111F55